MIRRLVTSVSFAAAAAAAPALLHAQIAIEPLIGGYIPASDVNQVKGSASNIAKTREGTMALGANLEFGFLRASAMYASGTTLKNSSKADIGKGNVLAAAGDLVIRPLPRVLVQPYLIAGAGEKFYKYDASSTLLSGGDKQSFALHGGLGADLMLGGIGVVAELTDFVSKGVDDKWNVHDAFVMVGLRIRP